jgi:PBP1b-binding outer membrane lipoprotein LpoB
MKKNTKKIILIIICAFLLTGCTKQLKDTNNKTIINKETGQSITENIICKPTNKDVIKIYKKNKVEISNLL